jgi:hypothetical protein
MSSCLWCQERFKPRSDGGSPQRYCSAACRRSFDGAARAWVRQAVDDGTLTLPYLQKAPQQRAHSLQRKVGSRATPESP